ncbi:MAG: hypothetical protein JWN91_4113 [Nocardioides sp.]|nr:hypothetical protein [Nocardioides sp.]
MYVAAHCLRVTTPLARPYRSSPKCDRSSARPPRRTPYGRDVDTTPQVTLGAVNVASDDPAGLAAFWAGVLGSAVPPRSDGAVFLPAAGPEGFAMFFGPRGGERPSAQGQHLDLTVPWGSRAAEVERIVGLGATHRWDILDEAPWVQWSTLEDPEGNLFCVAEHPPA